MALRVLLALLALSFGTAARADWSVASSKHFVVYSQDKPERLKGFAERLERFDSAMRFFSIQPNDDVSPSMRLTVFVVDDVADIRSLYGKGGEIVAGFYEGRASGSFAFVPRRAGTGDRFDLDPISVLQHEYAHHFMLNQFTGAFPGWLVEGYAEFFATAKAQDDGGVTLGSPPLYRAYGLMTGKPLSLRSMVSGDYDRLDVDQLDALYGRGWLLLHYLFLNKGRPGQLANYLRALGDGKTGADAATSAFGDLKQLDRELDKYLHAKTLKAVAIPASELAKPAVTVRTLSPGEDAILDVRMRSKRGVNEKTAPGIYARAAKIAAQYPNDTLVHTTLAEAAFDAGRTDESIKAADRALAIDPKANEAMIYHGRALARRTAAQTASTPADWAAVRRWYLSANALENDDAEPLMLFYQSYGQAGERPTANAVAALAQAQRLAPQDEGLRMVAARQLLTDGQGEPARKMMAPIAYSPHGGALAKAVQALIAELDRAGPAAALAMMESGRVQEQADKEE